MIFGRKDSYNNYDIDVKKILLFKKCHVIMNILLGIVM